MTILKIINSVTDFAEENNIPLTNIVVTLEAAVVMLGLLDATIGKIDLVVDETSFAKFKDKGFVPINCNDKADRIYIPLNDDFNIHYDANEYKTEHLFVTHGIRFTNMQRTYDDYIANGTSFDRKQIDKLSRYLYEN